MKGVLHKRMFNILMKRIFFILKCIKNSNNEFFIKRVNEVYKNSSLVDIVQYGSKNQGKVIYYIYLDDPGNGFFAEYRKVLGALYFAEMYGFIPVVEYAPSFSYFENTLIHETSNPYEYYFLQPSDITIKDMKESNTVINFREENLLLVEQLKPGNGYEITDVYKEAMAEITRKYIKLNPTIKEKMDNDLKQIFDGSRILGVHIRGTDFKQEFKRHPKFVTVSEYITTVKKIIKQYNFDKIFLATDDLYAEREFYKEFSDRLILFNDVIRKEGKESVMLSEEKRTNHHFLLGYEVLRDMYALAASDGIVAGLSQVSICARITKQSWNQSYLIEEILDNGISQKNKNCGKEISKIKSKKRV